MALVPGNPLPFGLRNVWIIPLADDDTFPDLWDDATDFGYARSVQYDIGSTEVSNEGNDRVLATEYFDEKGTGTLEAAGVNINGLAALWGQTAVTDGVSPVQITTLVRDVAVIKPYVALMARSKSSAGGAFVTTILKAKCGGGPNMTQQYGQFGNAQIPFSFIPNAEGDLISLDEYETFANSDDGGRFFTV